MTKYKLTRRWRCQECNETWEDRRPPAHEHPLVRLCTYSECDNVIKSSARCCSDLHGVLATRKGMKLSSIAAKGLLHGLWFLSERLRLGLKRAEVRDRLAAERIWVRCNDIVGLEVRDEKVPTPWVGVLLALGFAIPGPAVPPPPEADLHQGSPKALPREPEPGSEGHPPPGASAAPPEAAEQRPPEPLLAGVVVRVNPIQDDLEVYVRVGYEEGPLACVTVLITKAAGEKLMPYVRLATQQIFSRRKRKAANG